MARRVLVTIRSPRTWEREDLAWAAGLFEGEGCFSIRRDKAQITTVITMTDLDVLERFHEIVGIGRVSEIHSPSTRFTDRGTERKPLWRWQVGGHEGAQAIAAMFWPWLCARRKAKAVECLTHYRVERRANRQVPIHGTINMYNRHRCRCGGCLAANREASRRGREARQAAHGR